jgi:hypothetical protein
METQCPHCDARMNLKSRKTLGKRAPCPQCKKPFLVEELECIDDYLEDPAVAEIDDYDDYEPGNEPQPQSAAKTKKGKTEKRKKKKSSRKVNILLVLCGVIGVGSVVAGMLYWLVTDMFSSNLDLKYLPPNAHTITVEQVGSAWDPKEKEQYYSNVRGAVKKMEEEWGFGPKDMISYTTAISENETLHILRTSVDLPPIVVPG